MTPQPKQPAIIAVLPGDEVTHYMDFSSPGMTIKLGVGLRHSMTPRLPSPEGTSDSATTPRPRVYATLAGRLEQRTKQHSSGTTTTTWFVLRNCKRYSHAGALQPEDRVIGIIEDRAGSGDGGADLYRVHIGGSHPALLSSLEFEGATKRNRPHLRTGTLIYARVLPSSISSSSTSSTASKSKSIVSTPPQPMITDPFLSCQLGPRDISSGIPRKDWMTEEGLYGELKGGTLVKISLGLALELLDPRNVVLDELSQKKIPFEVCIGVNGYVWIHSSRPQYTILVQNAILNSEILTEEQTRGMVRSLIKTIEKQIAKEDEDYDDMEE